MQENNDGADGQLRIWYLHQVGSDAEVYHEHVNCVTDARLKLDSICRVMLHLYKTNNIQDYSNMCGLEIREDGDWLDWENESGECIDDVRH